MATLQVTFKASDTHDGNARRNRARDRVLANPVAGVSTQTQGAPVIIIFAYILALASVATVAMGGHFPWFTLAPAMVLMMAGHFRRIEQASKRRGTRSGN
jgi:hypothetical protein